MTTCPWTAARLHDLIWQKGFTPVQLVELARVMLDGEDVGEAGVLAWCEELGVSLRPIRQEAPPKLRAPRTPSQSITRPCEWCGKDVTRPSHRMHEHVYCDTTCAAAAQKAAGAARRSAKRARAEAHAAIEAAGGTAPSKRCNDCGITKSVTLFGIDPRRSLGRYRICLECQRARNRRNYEKRKADRSSAGLDASASRSGHRRTCGL